MYRKKIAAIMVFGLTMTTCSTPAKAQVTAEEVLTYTMSEPAQQNIIELMQTETIRQTLLEAQVAKRELLNQNTLRVKKAVSKLEKHVGKTWYVFSGSTPSGWDCSGMTLWFYENLGVDLEHRATMQSKSGKPTKKPKLGDIVVFKYHGSKMAYHVGIYISHDLMIHSGGKEGDRTEFRSISGFAGDYSKVSYRTFIETS
jgi:cell wall-associated NlpC family hydrolase